MGLAPCPRCVVLKKDLHKLGKMIDNRTRTNKIRKDTELRRGTVDDAINLIYNAKVAIDNFRVDFKLKDESLIAVVMRHYLRLQGWFTKPI